MIQRYNCFFHFVWNKHKCFMSKLVQKSIVNCEIFQLLRGSVVVISYLFKVFLEVTRYENEVFSM